MRHFRQSGGPVGIFPPITGNLRTLLFALGGLYFAELMLRNFMNSPIDAARWQSMSGGGFDMYQLATRYFVQGNSPLSVIISAVILVFFVPILSSHFEKKKQAEILLSIIAGSTLAGLMLDGLGLISGETYGWGSMTIGLVVLFGLVMPKATVNLFFVIPVQASIFTWGTGVITLLYLAASPTLQSAERFGVFLGTLGWWYLRGPGARRRELRKKGSDLEKELSKFTVLDGGKNDDHWH